MILARTISMVLAYCISIALIEKAVLLLVRLYVAKLQHKQKKSEQDVQPMRQVKPLPRPEITPLPGLDYRTIEPIKYRPFETKRHVTMGIKKSSRQDWIEIDRKYLDRLNYRKKLCQEHPDVCLGDSKIAGPAILELYEEVMLNLIPKRYPTIFRISGDVFENLVTGSRHSIAKARSDPRAMLRKIAENVEEDFYFMVPNADGEFVLQGFVACFPQGLLPAAKVGMTVSEIHKPVPDYEGRLQKGVNRCFARLGQGESIDRYNWAIQSNHNELFLPFEGANTLKSDDSPSKHVDVDPLSSFLRVEHHNLTSLPKTGVITFSIHTYITPLSEIQSEGAGAALAEACDSMPEKFGIYKNRPTWGQKVCSWLRDNNAN